MLSTNFSTTEGERGERERESERERKIISMKISRDFFRHKIGRTK